MTHEEICTYEVCKLAKDKGFPLQKVIKQDGRAFFYELPQSHPDWANCDAWYLPSQSLLQRWLREEKKIYVCPCIISDYEDDYQPYIVVYWSFIIVNTESGDSIYREYERVDEKRFDTYELALEDALKYALENLV